LKISNFVNVALEGLGEYFEGFVLVLPFLSLENALDNIFFEMIVLLLLSENGRL